MAKKHKGDVKKVEPALVEHEEACIGMSDELFDIQELPEMKDEAVLPVFAKPVYIVPYGSALNCRSRIVAGGEVVTADMVLGGEETINRLVSKGALVKK